MLDEKELEQVAVIVKRVQEKDDECGGCGAIIAGVVLLFALIGLLFVIECYRQW